MDVRAYNRQAWNGLVARRDRWTVPVSPAEVAAARRGEWEVVLTPTKPVPRAWFPPMRGLDLLGLASSGGQQCPLFAAAGANVTVLDNSPAQLGQDRLVAEREGLAIRTLEGDMRDLSAFADGSFALIFHPVSNCFVEEIRPVWRECFRVLRPGGVLLAGFWNPIGFLFDPALEEERGVLQLRYAVPYSDVTSLTDAERARYTDQGEPLAFGHSLEDQLGGQLDAGFLLTAMFEDTMPESALSRHLPPFLATRAVKPAR